MEDIKKENREISNSYPHNGKMLTDFIFKNRINRAGLARRLGVTPTAVYNYAECESLHLSTLWNASIALKHNFIAEIGALLPVEYTSPREKALQEELEKLKFELSIYKNIIGNK